MLFLLMRLTNWNVSLLQVQPVVLLWVFLQVSVVQFSLLLESVVERAAEARLLVVQLMELVQQVLAKGQHDLRVQLTPQACSVQVGLFLRLLVVQFSGQLLKVPATFAFAPLSALVSQQVEWASGHGLE
jgi:hypothetical protein